MPSLLRFRSRAQLVNRVRADLVERRFPRLQMLLLVALTGAFGLLCSFCLLRLGMEAMALRYPVALLAAYGFFLLLVGIWLKTNGEVDFGAADVADALGALPGRQGASIPAEVWRSGGGGDFGGGGASGTLDSPAAAALDSAGEGAGPVIRDSIGDGVGDAIGDAASAAAEGDELMLPLLVVALAVGLALASLYVVYIAPTLFAEVLIDGALSYGLFRHLRAQERGHWLHSALRHTVWPFAATAVFLAAVGAALTAMAPGAHSIGQVVQQLR